MTTPAEHVNTFIGTGQEKQGNTFPGASAPFGMIQLSPIGSSFPGWRSGEQIRGIGHSFVSGAGCWEQGGIVSTLPTTGTVKEGGDFDTRYASSFDHTRYASEYDGSQVGQAGYYRTHLARYHIDVETTARTRAGAERYTFGSGSSGNVFINVGQATESHGIDACEVNVVGEDTVEGWVRSKSFCSGPLRKSYTTWFRTTFDRPFTSFGSWDGAGGVASRRKASRQGGEGTVGAWVSFTFPEQTGAHPVTAVTAISKVDAEGARKNLAAEGMTDQRVTSFDTMRAAARQAWDTELARIAITGASAADATVFYTALYHALLQPMTGSDSDGRYRGFDDKPHTADGWTYHEYYSLWDTYRAQNQLLAMLYPSRARDIARSLLAINEQGGWLPKWGYANYETNVQTGDPVTPFLVDIWRFGALRGTDGLDRKVFDALWRNANEVPPAASDFSGRAGLPNYLAKGYVQFDPSFPKKGMDVDPQYGGSATFEYAVADAALAQLADALGEKTKAESLRARSRNWRNLWDKDTEDTKRSVQFTGFPAARDASGAFASTDPSRSDGFQEGTPWQYQWLAQHDTDHLVELMGGAAAAASRLDVFFGYSKLISSSGEINKPERGLWVEDPLDYQRFEYNPNNEPDLHAPWMYAPFGQPWKATTVNRAAQTLYTGTSEGIPGNDDLGTISAWYVLSALGVYPLVPGTGRLYVHAPRFTEATLTSDNGKLALTIQAPGTDSGKAQYVSATELDSKPLPQAVWVDWTQLTAADTLRFTLTTTPPSPAH